MSIAPGCDLTREEDVAMVGGNVDVGLGQEIIEREREKGSEGAKLPHGGDGLSRLGFDGYDPDRGYCKGGGRGCNGGGGGEERQRGVPWGGGGVCVCV